MTHRTTVSSTSPAALAAWLVAVCCVTPAYAQLDPGIAPNANQRREPRPAGPGSVLLGNPAEQRTAELTGRGVNPNLRGPAEPQDATDEALKQAIQNAKLDPELDKWLTAWERQSKGVQRLSGLFRLYTYDEVFQTETRAEGQFWYQNPDKGRMDFRPTDLSKVERDDKGRLINRAVVAPDKTPYEVKARDPEVWNCNGSEILQIFPTRKEYNRVAIPAQFQGESIKESPLPFLFGLQKSEAQERYLMKLGPMHGKVARGYQTPCVHVIALPLRDQDSREWSRAEVLLDSQTFLPQSIQTLDPAKTTRNVYAFAEIEVNSNPRWWSKDPFALNVSGLTLIRDVSAQQQPPAARPGIPLIPAGKAGGLK